MYLNSIGFWWKILNRRHVVYRVGLLFTVVTSPMFVLNHLIEGSIESSTLSLTNSLVRFWPFFIWRWVFLSRHSGGNEDFYTQQGYCDWHNVCHTPGAMMVGASFKIMPFLISGPPKYFFHLFVEVHWVHSAFRVSWIEPVMIIRYSRSPVCMYSHKHIMILH